jgi:hypothetical protein
MEMRQQYPVDYHCGVMFKHEPHYWTDGRIDDGYGFDCNGRNLFIVAYSFLGLLLIVMAIAGAVQY